MGQTEFGSSPEAHGLVRPNNKCALFETYAIWNNSYDLKLINGWGKLQTASAGIFVSYHACLRAQC